MRCCVPFCKNTSDNVFPSEGKGKISFHGFPSEAHLRAAWLRALGLGTQDSCLPDSAVVCSQHFLSDDIYETEGGLRHIVTGAVPSTVLVCMICLDTDSKLFLMSKYRLDEVYEKLTGHSLCDAGKLKQTVCVQCAQRLMNFSRLRAQSLRARDLMMDLAEQHELITRRHMSMIDRTKHQLRSDMVLTTLAPDHWDLHILENLSEEETESEEPAPSAVLKTDHSFDSFSVNEDIEMMNDEFAAYEDDVYNDSTLEANLADDALERKPAVADTQELLKCTSGVFRCVLCCEEFVSKNEYMQHIVSLHLQFCDAESEPAEPPVCEPPVCEPPVCEPPVRGPTVREPSVREPPTALSYSTSNSSLFTENKPAIATRHGDCRSADSTHTSVAPLSASLAMNNDSKVHATEEADTGQKSEQAIQIIESESHDQSSDGSNATTVNIHRFTNCTVKLYDIFADLKKFAPRTDESRTTTRKEVIRSSDSQNIASKVLSYEATSRNEVSTKEYYMEPATNSIVKVIASKTLQSKTCCVNNDINIQCKISSQSSLHTEEKAFTCDICRKIYKRKSLLVKHINTHTAIKRFACQFCHYKFKYKCYLVTHMKFHTGIKPYSCKLCDYKSVLNSGLTQHMRTHTGIKRFSCKLCDYKCSVNSRLTVHMRTHSGIKPFSCKLCDYKCSVNSTLIMHMRTHSGIKPFSCKLCDYKCAAKGDLVKHMRTHTGIKPFSCKLCDYKFSVNSNLIKHMRTHSGIKPFSCKLCDFKCAQKSYLVKHMRIHTGIKPFSCKLCDFKCAQNGNLVTHMRTHTGIKPFSCKLCDYKCSVNSSLIIHMSSHSGIKPFSCKLCDYKCAQNSDLVKHMRTHTKHQTFHIKLFSCKLCDFKCSVNSNLIKHMRTHSAIKPFSCK